MAGNPYDQFDGTSNSASNPYDKFDSAEPAVLPAAAAPSESWGDVATQALGNLGPSALATTKAIATPFVHPIDTAKSLGSVAVGGAQKLDDTLGLNAAGPESGDEKHFDSLVSYFGNRYGSVNGFKHAVATDPVGVATDMSAAFGTAGALAAKAPGIAGKAGEIASAAGRAANPVSAVVKGIGAVAKPVASTAAEIVGNLGTHTGAAPLKLAAQAGYEGGDAAQAFLDNMRGNAPLEDVVSSAKGAVAQMRADRSADYRSGMADVSKDQSVLSFDPVDAAIAKTNNVKNFKGVDISPATAGVRDEIGGILDQWKGLDPTEYHTPEGFDALKQRIGDVRDNLPYGTPQRLVADNAYQAVRGAITTQAPQYAKVMKDYETASDLIGNIQKTLSLNPKASVDTSLRKLQSVMRNNVNTNYGQRAKLTDVLAQSGAPNLPYQLAGQSLNKLTPRGLGAASAIIPAITSVGTMNPLPLAALPFMSPRLMGEAAYSVGAAGRKLAPLSLAAGKYGTGLAPAAYEAGEPMQYGLGNAPGTDAQQIQVGPQTNIPLSSATATLLRLSNPRQPVPSYASGGRTAINDAGKTIPESAETLKAQQDQLVAGRRPAMLFPKQKHGNAELPLPKGMARTETKDGVFHFHPKHLTAAKIAVLSKRGRLNEILGLGPHSKADIHRRAKAGEPVMAVTERTPAGIEVRAAAGTDKTVPGQIGHFERTKTPGHSVQAEQPQSVIRGRIVGRASA